VLVFLGIALLARSASADVRLPVAGGEDRWSQQVAAEWAPRSRAALLSLETWVRAQYGVELGERLSFAVSATPNAVLPEEARSATVLRIEAGLGEVELRQRALLQPLRQGMLAVVDSLSEGQAKRLPAWLPWGLAELTARQTVAGLGLPPLPSYAQESPITRPEGMDPRRAEQQVQAQQRSRVAQRLSLAAAEALQQRLGADFHPRMKRYLQASAQPDFEAEAAFAAQFGISQRDFMQQLEQGLAGAEKSGEAAEALAVNVARVDTRRDKPEVQQAWAAFLAAPKPRALVFSPEGVWGLGEQSQRPVDRAMEGCRSKGGSNCRLLALDDEMVLRPERAHVAVQMGGYVNDDFAAQVERDWLGLVRQASAQFDRLVNEVLQVRLSRDARIYVGAGVADYEQILQQDMAMNAERAEQQGEVSGGLSNSRGQIALKFTPRQNRAAAYELAVKTTLHELTHELQKQLDNNHAGFRPPIWLREGTADLIAYLLAPQVRINDAEADALRNWRERNLNWWRRGNKTGLQPEEMNGVTPQGWLRMMKDKRGSYQMAGLMCMYLQAITGARFLPAWVEYYRLAGRKNQRPGAAFEQAFGLSEDDFHADFKRWLVQQ